MNREFGTGPDAGTTASQAKRRAFLIFLCLLAALWLVNTIAMTADLQARVAAFVWHEPAVTEASSIVFMIPLFLLVWNIVERWPIGRTPWPRAIAALVLGSLLFSLVHVAAMAGARALIWPLLYGRDYPLYPNSATAVVEEYGKDTITYAVAMALSYLCRHLAEAQGELDSARAAAEGPKRLALKSDGRTVFLDRRDFRFAEADGNYVHIVTSDARHHVRISLNRLEEQLLRAEVNVLRSHKSWLVNADKVEAVGHKRNGDMALELSGGQSVPASRRYREAVLAKCAGS